MSLFLRYVPTSQGPLCTRDHERLASRQTGLGTLIVRYVSPKPLEKHYSLDLRQELEFRLQVGHALLSDFKFLTFSLIFVSSQWDEDDI